MDLEKRLEIYKSDYYFQIDFKEKLYARMAIYTVLITGCITANISMFEGITQSSGWYLTFSIFLWEILLITLIYILYGFLCISHIKVDSWVNTNNDMENYRNILTRHYEVYATPSSNRRTDEKNKISYTNEQFIIYLVEQYASCSTVIRDNNVYRQRWLTRIMSSTYTLLIITGVIGTIFLQDKI